MPRRDKQPEWTSPATKRSGASKGFRVECYAGYRDDETPLRLYCGERKVEVAEVLDRWLAPDHRYFKIKGDDGGRYIIRYDVASDQWELTMFAAD